MDGEQTYNGLLPLTIQTLANPLPKGSCIDCCQSSQALSQDEHAKHQALHWLLQEYLLQRELDLCLLTVKQLSSHLSSLSRTSQQDRSKYPQHISPKQDLLHRIASQLLSIYRCLYESNDPLHL